MFSTLKPSALRLQTPFTVLVFLITAVSGALAAWLNQPALMLAPAAFLAAAVFLPRFLRDPIPLFCGYLVVIANLSYFKIGGGISLDIIVSALLLWALFLHGGLKGRIVGASAIEKVFVFLLLVFAITVIVSVDPALSIRRWIRELQYLVFFAFVFHRPLSEREEKWIVRSCLVAVIAPCLTGLVGLIFGIKAFSGSGIQTELAEETLYRVRGTMVHPVTLSIFLGFFGLILMSLIQGRRYASRLVFGVLLLLVLVSTYYTYGRSGWFGFAAAIAALAWLQGRRWLLILGAPVLIAVLFILLPTFQERIVSSAVTGNDNSLVWRLRLWAYALEFYPRRPIFGSGLGTFLDYISFGKGFGSHSTWVGLLLDTGIVGLTAFIALLVTTWAKLWQAYRRYQPRTDLLLEGVMAGFISLIIAGMAASSWSIPSIIIYTWVLIAIVLHPDRRARIAAQVAEVSPPGLPRR